MLILTCKTMRIEINLKPVNMKHIFTLLLLLGFFVTASAQEMQEVDVLRTKRGLAILPQAGDYSLGFDAAPLANFALNFIKFGDNTGHTAEHPGYVSGLEQVIVGKYFMSENLAVRARFGINSIKTAEKSFGENPLTPSAIDPEVILLSTSSESESDVFLGVGLEKRRGHNRLQGIYGGELILGYGSSKVNNKYEIEFNDTAQDSGFISPGATRLLSSKDSGVFTLGVRGFVGVEYFVLPKISIGAEFGWSIGVVSQSRGTDEFEIWGIPPGSTSSVLQSYTREVQGDSSESQFGIAVDNGISRFLGSSAAIMVNFHF